MSKQDFYTTLGVQRTASADELKKAYRGLAMKFHPDKNPGDKAAEQKFKEISEAYEVLKDEQKRAAYDRFGHAAFEGGAGGDQRGRGFDFGFGSGFSDIFDEMFGELMGGRRQSGNRGSDLKYNLEISLEDAFHGTKTTIRVPTLNVCEDCKGSGAANGSQPVPCNTCSGNGQVRQTQGFFTIQRTCPACQGRGKVIKDPCKPCSGSGRSQRERTLQVDIPAGVDDGTRIRLAGEGQAGSRSDSGGDLYIFIGITPHPLFQRDGADIQCRVPIPMITATLGGTVEIPTIDGGRAELKIPAGTQSGAQFRLRGKGMSIYKNPARGDMYVESVVETPTNLTRRQQEILRDFEKAGEGNQTSPEATGFFAKMRGMWKDPKD